MNIQADEKFSYGKKIALGVVVRTAKYDNVSPHGRRLRATWQGIWIRTMASGFSNGRKIVVGHSRYAFQPGITNVLERYDSTVKTMQYVAFAMAGFPYMGVGRNLGYTSDLFFSAKGQRRHGELMSGDDDLFR
ncbi:MAG: hypothetical protein IPI00_06410 [Flavobacteriales bacterium]|nr:hypothetical protein [Flavobacteriales bacterium]